MPSDQQIAAKRREIRRRYQRKRTTSLTGLRLRDLNRLFRARHGEQLPDDPTGRACARIMAHHLVALASNPRRNITGWIALHAPWMAIGEVEALIGEVLHKPRQWRADKLAWLLRLIDADRRALAITTIGSIDVGKDQRIKRRRENAKLAARARRLANGAKPRAEYLASATSSAKPWIAAGISRRTWYRRRRGTGP